MPVRTSTPAISAQDAATLAALKSVDRLLDRRNAERQKRIAALADQMASLEARIDALSDG